MMALGPLFERPAPRPRLDHSTEEGRRRAFEAFHRENPRVYARLVELAHEARAAGCRRIGIRLLWERLRWDLTVSTRRPERAPKLNDHFPPFYARLLMAREPDLADFFEVRDRCERFSDAGGAP